MLPLATQAAGRRPAQQAPQDGQRQACRGAIPGAEALLQHVAEAVLSVGHEIAGVGRAACFGQWCLSIELAYPLPARRYSEGVLSVGHEIAARRTTSRHTFLVVVLDLLEDMVHPARNTMRVARPGALHTLSHAGLSRRPLAR